MLHPWWLNFIVLGALLIFGAKFILVGLLLRRKRHTAPSIDPNAPCPACGNRQGQMKWAYDIRNPATQRFGMIAHQCKVCGATWCEPPIVRSDGWVVNPIEEVREELKEEARK